MRLTPNQIEQIKQTTHRYADDVLRDWQLWLFGSRVNDEAKALMSICVCYRLTVCKALLTLKLKLRPAIEDVLDIPVDLVMQSSAQPIKLVTQQAMQTGIRLI